MGLKYDLFVLDLLGNSFWALQLYFEARIGLEQKISGRETYVSRQYIGL